MAKAVILIGQALGRADIWRWHCDERIVNPVGEKPTPTAAAGVSGVAGISSVPGIAGISSVSSHSFLLV
jgi:hypothetical protein